MRAMFSTRRWVILFSTCLLSACQAPVAPPPPITFTRYQPLYFDVGGIQIVDEYQSPMRPPYVEHLLPVSPADAMHRWVRDRMHAVGSDKTMQVIIKDASVKAVPAPEPTGIGSFFSFSHDNRYDARLDVEMRIYGGGPMSEASIEVTSTRSITIPASASLVERENLFRRLIFNLMQGANAELEKTIYQYFGPYLSYSHSP